jgi:hypothetical protein
MLSPVAENILSYIENIEEHYIEDNNWPYTYDEYKMRFNGQFIDEDDRKTFSEHKNIAKPITAKDMGVIMNVKDDTARSYLNDLVKAELLYVYRINNNGANLYYPVSDFEAKKEVLGVAYPKPDEVETLTNKDGKAIQEIYEEFEGQMKNKGYVSESFKNGFSLE